MTSGQALSTLTLYAPSFTGKIFKIFVDYLSRKVSHALNAFKMIFFSSKYLFSNTGDQTQSLPWARSTLTYTASLFHFLKKNK